ncbi:hypothetical protein [Sphingomonas sp.]|jgi:hypothetical protein|uniref:hypothetical protein n=1 Tax=Sphingomonas sp. TaxID=28214 RepID=UPI0026053297|nr:hypothetical protein [Sphingomonas sp.]MDF2603578.1 hypothetical protein [Sphingomonas sp.]
MSLRDRTIQTAVAGAVAAGTLGGFSILLWLNADLGDALGFFGGLLGAGAAVIGAIWVEDRKRSHSRRSETGELRLALEEHRPRLTDAIAELEKAPDDQTIETKRKAWAICGIIVSSAGVPSVAMDHGTAFSLQERRCMRVLIDLAKLVDAETAGDDEDVSREATLQVGGLALFMIDDLLSELTGKRRR